MLKLHNVLPTKAMIKREIPDHAQIAQFINEIQLKFDSVPNAITKQNEARQT